MSRKQRKKKVDMLAAQVLLQAYLDSKQPLRTGEPDSQGAV
jgi:RNase H-fold protein (predicted Holliday junction resolvase)